MNIVDIAQKEDCLIISPTSYKDKIIEELASPFYHAKFFNTSKLKELLFWEYTPDTLYAFSKEFHLIIENAQIILEALYAPIDKIKRDDLIAQKNWLEKNNFLIYHPEFLEKIKGKVAYIYGYANCEIAPFLSQLEKFCKVIFIEPEEKFTPKIFIYETLEDEVVGVAEKITKLISKKVLPKQIFICNVEDEYKSIVSKIFKYFNIPVEENNQHALYSYEWTQNFIKSLTPDLKLEDLKQVFESLEKAYPSNNELYHDFYEQTYAILNKYYQKNRTIKDIYDILIYEFKNTYLPIRKKCLSVQIVDFYKQAFKEDDYIFILGVNHTSFPKIKKDDDYYNNKEKEKLKIPTSLIVNQDIEAFTIKKINSLENISLSYKKRSPFNEYMPSSILSIWPKKEEGKYTYSNRKYNKYLLNQALDDYIDFNIKSRELTDLYGLEQIDYQNYDNTYKKISKNTFFKYIKECNLSYTSMQKYFECPFKFYLENILKVKSPFNLNINTLIGNVFHSILEEYFKNKSALDNIITNAFKNLPILPQEKKEVLIKIYDKEIRRLITIMEEQNNRSLFIPSFFEYTIDFKKKSHILFKIEGKIDKIAIYESELEPLIIVLDYKTSAFKAEAANLPYGLDMQLFLYLYLIKMDPKFKKYTLAGSYISPILEKTPSYSKGKTLKEAYWEQSKLNGFTIKRSDIIEKLDQEYKGSSYIKGITVKKDGEFKNNAQLISTPIMDKLLCLVAENIREIEKQIEARHFTIEPKKFNSDKSCFSCEYCPYKDICFKMPKDIKVLKKYKDLEFLKEEDRHDTDETDRCNMD